uniref:AlNc14C570G12177 protein n=1 Tax=Albugo laibachii Nc14 TaxID=890382 RepID=F0X183_9STRA|nr:AlNc14C570G12177 [Albugo laibachii Nc14]|eukprot:CCA27541.1 AlNc14C570G12177 [Albugo laibachii Nc14]
MNCNDNPRHPLLLRPLLASYHEISHYASFLVSRITIQTNPQRVISHGTVKQYLGGMITPILIERSSPMHWALSEDDYDLTSTERDGVKHRPRQLSDKHPLQDVYYHIAGFSLQKNAMTMLQNAIPSTHPSKKI